MSGDHGFASIVASDGLKLKFRGPFYNPKFPDRIKVHVKMDVEYGLEDLVYCIDDILNARGELLVELPEPVWIRGDHLLRLQKWLRETMEYQTVKALTPK